MHFYNYQGFGRDNKKLICFFKTAGRVKLLYYFESIAKNELCVRNGFECIMNILFFGNFKSCPHLHKFFDYKTDILALQSFTTYDVVVPSRVSLASMNATLL